MCSLELEAMSGGLKHLYNISYHNPQMPAIENETVGKHDDPLASLLLVSFSISYFSLYSIVH
jgi:hypothetical protein